jgi:hypothetical protein
MEGKQHNQALRALGRHLIRVLWAMVQHRRDYEVRTPAQLPEEAPAHAQNRSLAA